MCLFSASCQKIKLEPSHLTSRSFVWPLTKAEKPATGTQGLRPWCCWQCRWMAKGRKGGESPPQGEQEGTEQDANLIPFPFVPAPPDSGHRRPNSGRSGDALSQGCIAVMVSDENSRVCPGTSHGHVSPAPTRSPKHCHPQGT